MLYMGYNVMGSVDDDGVVRQCILLGDMKCLKVINWELAHGPNGNSGRDMAPPNM